MPTSRTSPGVEIPADIESRLRDIQNAAKTRACFDVLAWRGDQLLFIESKWAGHDRPTPGQRRFAPVARKAGARLLVVEWSLGPPVEVIAEFEHSLDGYLVGFRLE
jgi:hypothetical protein